MGVKKYLTGAAALARVRGEVLLAPKPPPAANPLLVMRYAGFTSEDFVVHSGIPNGRPACEVRLTSKVGCGVYTSSEVPPTPAEVNTGATARWLAGQKFAPDGSSWLPAVGGGHALIAGPAAAPYLDSEYSFQVRGGEEVSLPAVVFSEGNWMKLDSTAFSAGAYTVAVVAVLHLNPVAPMYGIFETYTQRELLDTELATPLLDWGVRYRQGTIELWSGGVSDLHSVMRAQARPVVIVASFGDAAGGRLVVLDRNKSSISFSTEQMQLYDSTFYLGRTGDQAGPGESAWMDVLEFDYFDHALTFDEINELTHQLDSCYGVVG
jgi:hypothetical protein